MLRYKPWKLTQNNAWDDLEPTYEVFVTCWEQFLRTPYAQNHVSKWNNKLADVGQLRTQNDTIQDLPASDEIREQEEWMTASNFAVPLEQNERCTTISD